MGRFRAHAHDVAHVRGDGKALDLRAARGDVQDMGGLLGTGRKAQGAARGPEGLAVGRRAHKAGNNLVGREDLLAYLGELGDKGVLLAVPVLEKIAQVEVVVHAAHELGCARRGRQVGAGAGHRGGVPGPHKVLLQGHLALGQDVTDGVGVGEDGGGPDLLRDAGQVRDLGRKRAGRDAKDGNGAGQVVFGRVRLNREGQVAQVGLGQGVQVRGAVGLRPQLAEKIRQDACVDQLAGCKAAQVKVEIQVVDAVGVQLVGDAGQGRRGVEALRLGAGRLDVGHAQLGQAGQGLGRVGGLLLGAQGGDLGGNRGQVVFGHRGAKGGQLGFFLGGVAVFHGHQLDLGAVGAVAHQAVKKLLVKAGVQARLGRGQGLFVVDIVKRALVVVEPRRHDGHGQAHAVGVAAPVALAQVELGLRQRCGQLVVGDARGHDFGAGGLEKRAELLAGAFLGPLQGEHDLRLQDAVDEARVKVVAQVGVQDRALERGLVGSA